MQVVNPAVAGPRPRGNKARCWSSPGARAAGPHPRRQARFPRGCGPAARAPRGSQADPAPEPDEADCLRNLCSRLCGSRSQSEFGVRPDADKPERSHRAFGRRAPDPVLRGSRGNRSTTRCARGHDGAVQVPRHSRVPGRSRRIVHRGRRRNGPGRPAWSLRSGARRLGRCGRGLSRPVGRFRRCRRGPPAASPPAGRRSGGAPRGGAGSGRAS